jgi:hypothetical protein
MKTFIKKTYLQSNSKSKYHTFFLINFVGSHKDCVCDLFDDGMYIK